MTREIIVQAQKDHIAALAAGSPVAAIAELVWNALDADAQEVRVDVALNALGGVDAVRVTDDGAGIDTSVADRTFGGLGGSWKRDAERTAVGGRRLHGRRGKGRFKAFALGRSVQWRTTVRMEQGLVSAIIEGSADDPTRFTVSGVATPGPATGTEVCVTACRDTLGVLADAEGMTQQLAAQFALYLKAYPGVSIYYNGLPVDPVIMQRASQTYRLTSSGGAAAQLQVIEWKRRGAGGRIVFCDARGFALQEVEAGVRPGCGFVFTAFLVSDRFAVLNQENALVMDELNPEVKAFLEASRETLRRHFRERRMALEREQFDAWRGEGSYPFTEEDTSVARRRFDACAAILRSYADNFDTLSVGERTFVFQLLKLGLETRTTETCDVLCNALKLPVKRRGELTRILSD